MAQYRDLRTFSAIPAKGQPSATGLKTRVKIPPTSRLNPTQRGIVSDALFRAVSNNSIDPISVFK